MEPKPLPSKEASLYRSVLKLHLSKQYKRALKNCEAILRRVPDHGETLAMKGLCIYESNPSRKDEAFDLARQGIKCAMRSSTVWHVYGMMHKQAGDLDQASKSFLQAYKLNDSDSNVLRDLTYLLAQTRHLEEYNEYGRQLLTKVTGRPGYWLAFAMSFHLLKDYAGALHVLDTYEETLFAKKEVGLQPMEKVEFSERTMYRVQLLMESGDHAAALDFTLKNKHHMRDKSGRSELLVKLYTQLDRREDAIRILKKLIAKNPDHAGYWRDYFVLGGLMETQAQDAADVSVSMLHAVPVSEDAKTVIISALDEAAANYPRAMLPKRLPLDVLSLPENEAELRARLHGHLKIGLRKGILSTFSDLRPLMKDDAKAALIAELVESFERSMDVNVNVNVETAGTGPCLPDETVSEKPSTLLWIWLFRARMELWCGRFDAAMEYAERSIAHTPTYIEGYLIKAKILKRVGDFVGAAGTLDVARRMDLADRYVNTKHCAALIRAGKVEEAEGVFQLFTKTDEPLSRADPVPPNPEAPFTTLADMQVVWFEIAAGHAFEQRGERGLALRMFKRAEKCYQLWREDEADFHYYCMRRATLRSYCELLEWEDKIFSASKYQTAVAGMIRLYLSLHRMPPGAQERMNEEAELAAMPPADRRKAIAKKKKREKKEAVALAAAQAQATAKGKGKGSGSGVSGGGTGKPAKKADFEPDELEKESDPLMEAKRLLVPLLSYSEDRAEAHALEFDVYSEIDGVPMPIRCARALLTLYKSGGGGEGSSASVNASVWSYVVPRLAKFVAKIEAGSIAFDPESVQGKAIELSLTEWVPSLMQASYGIANGNVSANTLPVLYRKWLADVLDMATKASAAGPLSLTLPQRKALVVAMAVLGVEDGVRGALELLVDVSGAPGVTLEEATDTLRALRDECKISESDGMYSKYVGACRALYPHANAFGGSGSGSANDGEVALH